MIRRLSAATLLLALTLPAGAQAPAGSPFLPSPWIEMTLSADALVRRCARAIWRARAAVASISAMSEPARTLSNSPEALDSAVWGLYEQTASAPLLEAVSLSSRTRSAARQCRAQIERFRKKTYESGRLLDGLLDYQERGEKHDPVTKRLIAAQLLDFRRNGMNISLTKRAKLKTLRKRDRRLTSEFVRNVDTLSGGILVSRAELEGLSPDYIGRLKKKGDSYWVTIADKDYLPFISRSSSTDARRLLESLYSNRAATKNLPLLAEVLDLRYEEARLLKYRHYAQFKLETTAARRMFRVVTLLNSLSRRLRPRARSEMAAMLREREAREGVAGRILPQQDWHHYADVLRRSRGADGLRAFRTYFPLSATTKHLLGLSEDIFGITINKVPDAAVWDPSVTLYAIRTERAGPPRAYFYLDLKKRDGDRRPPRAVELIKGRTRADGTYRLPVSLLVGSPGAGRHGLLTHEELRTLMSAVGDLMQQILGRSPYGRFSGTSVPEDMRQVPGRLMESLSWRYEVLRRLSGLRNEPSERIPVELAQALADGRTVDRSLRLLEEVFLARLDMRYHSAGISDTSKEYARLKKKISLIPMTLGAHPQAARIDFATNGAGLYSRLWATAIAEDLLTRFDEEGLTPLVGRTLRTAIIEPGWSMRQEDIVRRFLGRPSNAKALLRSAGVDVAPGSRL